MSYSKIGKLNKGAYGIIYGAKDKNEKNVVIKRVIFEKKNTDAIKGLIGVREVDYSSSLDHPYIIKAKELLHEKPFGKLSPKRGMRDDKIYLVFPRAKYTMEELIYKCETPISHIKRAMFQVLVGLDYLHSKGICHRDIKPDNMLCFYEDGILTTKLCDFGMSKPLFSSEKNSTHVVTSVYRPPEILLGDHHYDFSIDIWALGVSFYEMVTKIDLFTECSHIVHLNYIFKLLGTPSKTFLSKFGEETPKFRKYEGAGLEVRMKDVMPFDFEDTEVDHLQNPGTWDQFTDLLKNMIQVEPNKRFTAFQCLQHPFFSGYYSNQEKNFGLLTITEPYPRDVWEPTIVKSKEKIQNLFKPYFVCLEEKRILFLALDMFIRIVDQIKEKQEEYCKVCIYLAYKYFMDVQCPEWIELFGSKPKTTLTKMENNILRDLLKYKIYRPLLWDIVYLKNKNVSSLDLLEFIVSGESNYEQLLTTKKIEVYKFKDLDIVKRELYKHYEKDSVQSVLKDVKDSDYYIVPSSKPLSNYSDCYSIKDIIINDPLIYTFDVPFSETKTIVQKMLSN